MAISLNRNLLTKNGRPPPLEICFETFFGRFGEDVFFVEDHYFFI